MSRKFLTPVGLLASASDPTGTFSAGDTYYNTTTKKVKTYNGTSWVDVGGSGEYYYQSTAPTALSAGAQWTDSDTGILYTWLDDTVGSPSGQWVELGASGFSGTQGIQGTQGPAGSLPSSPTFTGTVTAGSFVKSGGASTEFLMADGSVNSRGHALGDLLGYTSTATAGGTTTLTATSTPYQTFTGTLTQTVVLPNTSTMSVGAVFYIDNDSTDGLFVNASGGSLVINIPYGYSARITCISTAGAGTPAEWDASYNETHSVTSMAITTATKTLTSTTASQAIFSNTAGLTTGALTVDAATTYEFEAMLNLSSMSATSGNMGFSILGAGTATFTSAMWAANGLDATAQTTAAAIGGMYSASATATGNIVTAATGTALHVHIRGMFRVNAGGTIIPSLQLTTATAAVLGVNSYFKCTNIGSNTFQNIGRWA